ncbi:MAG: AbrB/MazE/SpoVT family DNA-binding domain-containing protein [Nitrospinae bacterium]|jgi:antitoxin MazE|nr:AbrB/MazE/SpoVT family DNA-binding domain-containing protein [Nitrospinota bacterium]MDA1110218.1 AbrB/MazE/SpoVT family DNA-binding domain-containing protein [Nitrospinota bacterium]
MESRVSVWGNSLGLRIPKAFAKEIGLKSGSKVRLEMEKGKIVVKPITKYSLKSLVDQITPENQSGEMDFGRHEGQEIW